MNKDNYIQTENYAKCCDICGDYFISYRHATFYMCDKCKAAILKIRREMEEKVNERDE